MRIMFCSMLSNAERSERLGTGQAMGLPYCGQCWVGLVNVFLPNSMCSLRE